MTSDPSDGGSITRANHPTDGPGERQDDRVVGLHPATRVVLRRGELASPQAADRRFVDEHWDAVCAVRSGLFDGPLVAVVDVITGAGSVEVIWAATSYRSYLARHAKNRLPFARSLYVAVLLRTWEGGCVIGQMATDTSNPGRLQLPGGNVEPPERGAALAPEDLTGAARRELLEETGVDVPASKLRLWAVKTGGSHGDVGVIYTNTDPLSVEDVKTAFAAHLQAEATAGQRPELTDLHLVAGPGDVEHLTAERVDYLDAVLLRHEQESAHARGT